MSSRLELSPAELDRLEDALEALELGPAPAPDPSDPVAQRLVEFREVLELSREALPLEEVPAGVLDGVLAEARQAAAAAPSPRARSLWSRMRLGIWVPTLAFAGSAALLLVVLLPERADEAPAVTADAAAPDAPPEAADRRLAGRVDDASAVTDEPFGRDGVPRGGAVAIGERAPEPEPAPEAESELYRAEADPAASLEAEEQRSAPTRRSRAKASAPKPSGGGSKRKGEGGVLGGAPAAPSKKADVSGAPAEEQAVDLWPQIVEGDALRRQGNCGLAKMRYAKARRSNEARVRGRALAGEGLCEHAAGRTSTATKLFAQARAADPSVGVFIESQLPAEPLAADEASADVKE